MDKPNSPAVPAGTAFSRPRASAFAWLVLALGLMLTAMASWHLYQGVQADAHAAFGAQADRLQADILARLAVPRQTLKASRAAWYAGDGMALSRENFARYAEALGSRPLSPGMRGIGFIERVPRNQLQAFVAVEQRAGAPAFAVQTSGSAADLYVIKFIEPADANRRALGYDIGSDPVRREAAEQAVRTGEPTLSGPISLAQAMGHGPGMLYLLPVYRWGAPAGTPAEREAALVGLLYSPIVVDELLKDAAALTAGQIDFVLVDSGTALAASAAAPVSGGGPLLAASGDANATLQRPAGPFYRSAALAVGGRTWTLHTAATPAFVKAQPLFFPWVMVLFGTVASGLLTLLIWRLGGERDRATAHAERATAELAVERQRLADIIDGANIATWERDIPTGTARFDERWAGELGYTLKELGATSFDKFLTMMHPDDVPGMNDALARHFAGQTPYYQCEYRVRHKDGHWLWMLVRGSVSAWDGPGRPRTISGMRMNITDRKLAQAALSDANTALEDQVAKRTAQLQRAVSDLQDFSYSIAHDIRQPLISLDGFSRLLARELGAHPTAEATHYLARLRAGVRQIGDLTDGLLALAHVSTAPLSRQAVDLTTLARDVFAARHRQEPARPATAHIAEGLVAHGDRAQLHKLLTILIDNAFKFSRDQAAVDVTVHMETGADGREVFHVTDRGTGFDMAHASRLFEPFQRLHPQKEYAGMGIGLASAHRIVSRHNGSIWADAQPGAGARFSFTLGAPASV